MLVQYYCLLWSQWCSPLQLQPILLGKINRPISPRRLLFIQQSDTLQSLRNQLRTKISSLFVDSLPIKITFELQQLGSCKLILLPKLLLHKFQQCILRLWFSNIMQFPESNLFIEIEVWNILLPVIDSYSMHLISFKHHQILLLELNDHPNMIKITHSEESLQLGTEVLSSE